MNQINSVWEGVFKSFEEAEGDLDAFDSDIWINKQKLRVTEGMQKYRNKIFHSNEYPLSIMIATILSQNESLKILDFGGGMGLQYLELIATVPDAMEKVEYYIVDAKKLIENRPRDLNIFKKLYFFTSIENIKENIDIIHIGSTLQYIDDWRNLLVMLNAKHSPYYYVFSDILAGNIPTFISHQIFYNKKIPIRQINIDEFRNFVYSLSFKLIYLVDFQVPILGNYELPNSSLPENYRLKHSCNMIFKKLSL
ncbi:methyltransferase, TIGR04325 family [Fluviispira multicolorata]|uniref:Methyltransferase, TIGR04325 family n=1 Tax=Fluviispira multicolorata TaxID=2654512 RepID=A0A833N054_9BACT|nr:methyltransferase, TIGR04325 family [Fluviispira multicolorata]KAB8028013.1 methyltransferase, TIGR04325 family [Fluviispira multicolorata]